MLTPVRRALLSVSDKTGIVEFARELKERGIELLSTGGTAKLLVRHGISVKEVAEHTGLPGDHGRPSENSASEDTRRAAGAPRRRRRRHARARHRADRSARGQSLSVCRDRRAARLQLRRCGREHRHRRPGDGARRRKESRVGDGAWWIPAITAACSTNWRPTRALPVSSCARSSRPRPLRTRRSTMPWCPHTSPAPSAEPRRRFPDDLNLSFRKRLGLALRRKPASTSRVLLRSARHRRLGRASARSCRARSCRTTTSRTATPRSNACASSRRRRASSSSTPIPAASRSADVSQQAYARAYRTRPHLRVRRHHRLQSRTGCRRCTGDPRAAVRRGDSRPRA